MLTADTANDQYNYQEYKWLWESLPPYFEFFVVLATSLIYAVSLLVVLNKYGKDIQKGLKLVL